MSLRTMKHIVVYFLVFVMIIGLTSTFTAKRFINHTDEVGLKGEDMAKMQMVLNGATISEGKFAEGQSEENEESDQLEATQAGDSENIEETTIEEFQKGDTGEKIKEYQAILNQLGHLKSKADGVFGSMTYSAVLDYQETQKLEPTGKLDIETIKALNSYMKEQEKNQESTETNSSGAQEHIVQSGDSLSTIGNKYNVSVNQILEANNLTENTVLNMGQKITIPKAENQENKKQSNKTNNSKSQEHIVQSGESLSTIGSKYNVSVSEILKANNLTENTVINIGQKILIPTSN